MTRDELEAKIIGWDGGVGYVSWSEVQAALDEYTRERQEVAWNDGCGSGYYDAAGYAEAGPNPYSQGEGDGR